MPIVLYQSLNVSSSFFILSKVLYQSLNGYSGFFTLSKMVLKVVNGLAKYTTGTIYRFFSKVWKSCMKELMADNLLK